MHHAPAAVSHESPGEVAPVLNEPIGKPEQAADTDAAGVVSRTDEHAVPLARTGKKSWDGVERRKSRDDDGSSLRVGVQVLDQLMNLVGELALSRNQLLQLTGSHEDSEFGKPVQQLNRVTTDLLEAVMKTRMQPIANSWTKLPRIIRDLAQASGKQISLECYGAETELDRQILQAIQDPLTHMIRNSADHGIELPQVRIASGKPAGGVIRLSARHEGGHVVIELADDGAGIDPQKIKRKAVERGLVRADIAESLADHQLLRFIFEPGFSTAEKITNVSGRGVGMDVVRSNIEAIGGTVDLSSVPGHGTTIRVKIPLTLAIIQALLVGTAGETFAVPQIGVIELVRITEEQQYLVEMIHGAEFYRLRETLLPLVRLDDQLRLAHGSETRDRNIVVCQVGELRFGLVVDEVFDTQEIVVKPVGRMVKHLATYPGCTITGDGRVIMILDTAGIASSAAVCSRTEDAVEETAAHQLEAAGEATASVLLFDAGFPALQAVALSQVSRLEEFPQEQFEEADGRMLVQYRGTLMPIIPANPAMQIAAQNPRPVIVFNNGSQYVGIAVDEIRDIIDASLAVQRAGTRPGVLGVGVMASRAAEIVDLDWFFREAAGRRTPSLTPVHGSARIAA